MSLPRLRDFLLMAGLVAMAAQVWSQSAGSGAFTDLSAAQIADRMQIRDQERSRELRFYKALRHYEVEYRGFSKTVQAAMDVEVDYDSSSGKQMVIVSQSGSKFLIEKVLKRAVDSEKEAAQDKRSTALTTANYRFQLMGREMVAGRPAYLLKVEPLVPSKFLYRGKIWVDAADFAMVKMETEPSKSPSFWISRTAIHYTGSKTDGFWMPQVVRSETSVRVGGTAVLTIHYGSYQIASDPLADPPITVSH